MSRAERKTPSLRPSNLIWIMPAQGGFHLAPVPSSTHPKVTSNDRITLVHGIRRPRRHRRPRAPFGPARPLARHRHRRGQRPRRRLRPRLRHLEHGVRAGRRLLPAAAPRPPGAGRRRLAVRGRPHRHRDPQARRRSLRGAARGVRLHARRERLGRRHAALRPHAGPRRRARPPRLPLRELARLRRRAGGHGSRARHGDHRPHHLLPGIHPAVRDDLHDRGARLGRGHRGAALGLVARALARTGALSRFASGRDTAARV